MNKLQLFVSIFALISGIILCSLIIYYCRTDIIQNYLSSECKIDQCVYQGTDVCTYYRAAYTCYKTHVAYTLIDTNFTKSDDLELYYNYTCNVGENKVCYYDIRNINNTLTLIEKQHMGIMSLVAICTIIVLLSGLLIKCVVDCIKLMNKNNQYISIGQEQLIN